VTRPSVLDVILVELRVGESHDRRPCIVVRTYPDGRFEAFACSSAWALYDGQFDFPIPDDDPHFPETGLKRSSYAIERALVSFPPGTRYTRLGSLVGSLAERFSDWFGEDLCPAQTR